MDGSTCLYLITSSIASGGISMGMGASGLASSVP